MTTRRLDLGPSSFGRRQPFVLDGGAAPAPLSDDLRLFALTYAAGFLIVSIFLA